MQEYLALTFKPLLCPLLVVNRVPKSGWGVAQYKWSMQLSPLLLHQRMCVHTFNADIRAHKSGRGQC